MIPETFAQTAVTRRRFLVGGAAAAAVVGLAACGGDDEPSADSTSTTGAGGSTTAPSGGAAGGDAEIARTAASLELLAVAAYKSTLDAATGNKIGTVPPAVATFVQTAMSQHQQAQAEWDKVVAATGGQKVSAPPASLKATVDSEFAKVKDVVGAAKLALLLEQTAADTYLKVGPDIKDKGAIQLAGAFQSVCQERAAILNFVLGEYPVPDVFQKTDKAFSG